MMVQEMFDSNEMNLLIQEKNHMLEEQQDLIAS